MKKLILPATILMLSLSIVACTGNVDEQPSSGVMREETTTASLETTGAQDTAGETIVPDGESESESESESETAHEHTSVTDARVEPTCGDTGLTEGRHCSDCGKVLVAQEVIPATRQHAYDETACTVCGAKKPTEGLKYTLNSDGVSYSVSGIGSATAAEIMIADTYENLPVTSIGSYAFVNCKGLTSITIPDSVTSIGEGAFADCDGLTSITIPDSVTSIGENAFMYCECLTSITIPDSVTSIGRGAFSGCSSFTSITVMDGNPIYHSAGNCLIETECKTLIAGCNSSIIPTDGSVTSIGEGAFDYCECLTNITIPDSVTSIGDYAFSNCSSLTSITIPESVTNIGNSAFYNCRSLTSITIPDSVTSIGAYAFYYCSSLTSITFQGTTAEWQAITKGTRWNTSTGTYTIYCTDGTISKDGTVTPNA